MFLFLLPFLILFLLYFSLFFFSYFFSISLPPYFFFAHSFSSYPHSFFFFFFDSLRFLFCRTSSSLLFSSYPHSFFDSFPVLLRSSPLFYFLFDSFLAIFLYLVLFSLLFFASSSPSFSPRYSRRFVSLRIISTGSESYVQSPYFSIISLGSRIDRQEDLGSR